VRARYTLEFAPPEVVRAVAALRAASLPCARPADIWALGVICYELLTGEPFFPASADREEVRVGLVLWGEVVGPVAERVCVQMRDCLIGLEPLAIEEDPRRLARVPAEGGLRTCVERMLSREPRTRPHAPEVVKVRSLRLCAVHVALQQRLLLTPAARVQAVRACLKELTRERVEYAVPDSPSIYSEGPSVTG